MLLVRAGTRVCALPLRHVAETLRPLPVSPLADVPPFVQGAAVVRGHVAPVVRLGALLGGDADAPRRFVLLTVGERRALLAVDDVLGVAPAPRAGDVPLLSGAAGGTLAALGSLDRDLLAVLDAARLVPEEVWRAVDVRGAP